MSRINKFLFNEYGPSYKNLYRHNFYMTTYRAKKDG